MFTKQVARAPEQFAIGEDDIGRGHGGAKQIKCDSKAPVV